MAQTRTKAFMAILLGWAMFLLVAASAITTKPDAEQYTKDKQEATKDKIVLVQNH